MTNATTTVIARVAALVAGIALVATSVLPMAYAQTMSASATASATFTRDLTLGSTGADVTALQNWLISKGHTIAAGATGYFGAQTKAALAAWQAANGVTPAAGYFGPITRAKVMAAGGSTTGGNTGGNTGGLSGGEASLEDLNATSGEEDDVEEGAEAEIAEFEFDVEDGDARIERLDLTFEVTADSGEEDEPWETFETITIMDGEGNELASEDVTDEDEWLEEDEPYVFRFTNLDYMVEEGDMATLLVTVEAQNGVDGVSTGDIAWEVYIDEDGVRAIDGEGVEQYIGDAGESVNFDVTEEGNDDDLSIRRSTDDPDSTTLMVEDDSTSDWYTIFAFDFDSDEDSGEIEIKEIPVVITTTGDVTSQVVNDVRLMIDGEEFDDYDAAAGFTTASSTYTFDTEDEDLTIEGGDRLTVEVMVEFKAQTGNYNNGQTVEASITGAGVEAEGADDVTVTDAATGDEHTLRAEGINVEATSDSASTQVVDGTDNDYATFTVKVDVEAFDQDVYIPKNAADAFTYQIENGTSGAVLSTSTATTSAVSSSADEEGSYYVIDEGSTESFTFTVTLDPLAAGEGQNYRMQVLTIRFNDTAATPDTTYTASPANEFETDSTLVND